ncbi:MAG: proline--tRNA ligase [Chloroflexota bacterium]|nr:proline--tRNA ligase [Chloroflexota bacterium]
MRMTKLFGRTLRQVPADADTASHQFLLKAGMIHQVAAGVYSYLPLGWRVLRKIEQIIREEMDAASGQELMMPVLQPLEIWEESGRVLSFGKALFTLEDRRDRKLCLGPTHEEIITNLAHLNIQSYRDLPAMPYQIQTKFRDEPRSRGGLLRVREFLMKDAYSMDANAEALDRTYNRVVQAYNSIYARCGLPAVMVEADSGAIGGKHSHEFMLIAETGEDEVIYCSKCDYAANAERASFTKTNPGKKVKALPLEEVATPGAKTIDEVSRCLEVLPSQIIKAVFYTADDKLVFVIIRGDLEVNEVKLKNTLKCFELRLATEGEIAARGLVAGFASPIGLFGVKIIADDSISLGSNFVVGANKPDAHFKNANFHRDFEADIVTDIALAEVGYACPRCDGALLAKRGIEVGHTFKLGTVFSEKLDALYLDQDGVQKPILMGCYGIGLGRLLAAAVEQNHDEKGIIWPISIAPYQVCLCVLSIENTEVSQVVGRLNSDLKRAGFEVLFDDREESAGVKFNDADLIGIPIRVVVSPRTLKQGSAEIKRRTEKEAELVPLDKVQDKLSELLALEWHH